MTLFTGPWRQVGDNFGCAHGAFSMKFDRCRLETTGAVYRWCLSMLSISTSYQHYLSALSISTIYQHYIDINRADGFIFKRLSQALLSWGLAAS
jgi:hypothetical protein